MAIGAITLQRNIHHCQTSFRNDYTPHNSMRCVKLPSRTRVTIRFSDRHIRTVRPIRKEIRICHFVYNSMFCIFLIISDDFDVSSSFPQPKATVLSKSGGNTVTKKRWRYWNTGVPAKQPRFRETLLKKPREAGEKSTNASRPGHEEYQTIAGISFPAGTGDYTKFSY